MHKSRGIYKPGGRALEYSDYALDVYWGCSHGCRYCWITKGKYGGKSNRRPKCFSDLLQEVTRQVSRYRNESVLLQFGGDCYCSLDDKHRLTRYMLELFLECDIKPVILTKAGLKATRDFDILSRKPEIVKFGQSLTFNCREYSGKWEPYASSPDERVEAFRIAKEHGFRTWASCEPIIKSDQTIDMIEITAPYVDEYKIGRWNHWQDMPSEVQEYAKSLDWRDITESIRDILMKLGKDFYIKNDLRTYTDPPHEKRSELVVVNNRKEMPDFVRDHQGYQPSLWEK